MQKSAKDDEIQQETSNDWRKTSCAYRKLFKTRNGDKELWSQRKHSKTANWGERCSRTSEAKHRHACILAYWGLHQTKLKRCNQEGSLTKLDNLELNNWPWRLCFNISLLLTDHYRSEIRLYSSLNCTYQLYINSVGWIAQMNFCDRFSYWHSYGGLISLCKLQAFSFL